MLLLINIISLGISAGLCSIGAYVLNNMMAVVICMVAAIAIRSLITNIYLSKIMEVPNEINVIWECVLSLIFIVINLTLPMYIAFFVYLAAYVIYCLVTRNTLMECISSIKKLK